MDRDLVERAMAGDHDAFSELARVMAGRLYAVARLILRDEGQAEDATQEALVAAWRHIRALRDPDRFDAWLHQVLVRSCYREARRHRPLGSLDVAVGHLALSEPDRSLDLADRDQLERGFARLGVDQRSILVLHYYVGLRLDEVAQVLGHPPGTIRSRLHRATQAMRAALDADARPGRLPGRRLA
jgi:RNA polymerase sigma-70 factor (ECF subfamily)